MKKIVIIILAVMALVFLLGQAREQTPAQSNRAAQQEAAAAEFVNAVSAAVKSSPKWSGIQADEAGGSDYKLTLLYGDMPSNQAEVERDTRAVAHAALKELLRQGRQPAQEHIFLTVRAHKAEIGATGQPLTRVFGRAVYDYNNDSIQYKKQQ